MFPNGSRSCYGRCTSCFMRLLLCIFTLPLQHCYFSCNLGQRSLRWRLRSRTHAHAIALIAIMDTSEHQTHIQNLRAHACAMKQKRKEANTKTRVSRSHNVKLSRSKPCNASAREIMSTQTHTPAVENHTNPRARASSPPERERRALPTSAIQARSIRPSTQHSATRE